MANGKINKSTYVICNGFKRDQYIENISRLINNGHKNTIPIIDNFEELDLLQAEIKGKFKIEFVSHLKKSQNLNSIRPALELVIKHCKFYKTNSR
jgi:hypothetical protein